MKPYTYRPLLPAKHSIRLVQILPGLPGTEIRCRIIDYTIRDDRVSGLFEALSYVWGETTDPKRISVADVASTITQDTVDGYLAITSNLHDALQELRDPALPRTLWIDAVCINQDDLEERASQVNFMAKIYSHAGQVVVWLGLAQGNYETGELFAAIENAADVLLEPPAVTKSGGSDRDEWRVSAERPRDPNEHVATDEFLNTALDSLLRLPWFSRVWVLQEAATARALVVKCGAFEMPGPIFTNGVQYLLKIDRRPSKEGRVLSASVLEMMTRNMSALGRPFSTHLLNDVGWGQIGHARPLSDLIERFYLHGATDQRDTIFALLNLCSPESRGSMQPDYTLAWTDIWAATIRQILGSETIVTCPTQKQACMTLNGYVLGSISLSDGTFSTSSGSWRAFGWKATWAIQSWCKSIQDGDIVFLAAGAAAPSVIRACDDHFDVIFISLPPPVAAWGQFLGGSGFGWQDLLPCLRHGCRRANLVWDWSPHYPSSCIGHVLLLDNARVATNAHPDEFARMEDFINIMASVPDSLRDMFPDARPTTFAHIQQQSEKPGFPSYLATKVEILRMFSAIRGFRLYKWVLELFQDLRYMRWMMTHQTGSQTSDEVILDYFRSEGYPYHTMFDLMPIIGLKAHLHKGGTTTNLRFSDASNTDLETYFSALLNTNLADYFVVGEDLYYHLQPRMVEHGSILQSGITQYMSKAVIRHSGTAPTDIGTSAASLLTRPSIQYDGSEDMTTVNLRAYALISACRGRAPTLPYSELQTSIRNPRTLYFCARLFSDRLADTQTAYDILSSILSLEADAPPLSLLQRIIHCQNARSFEQYTDLRSSQVGYHWCTRDGISAELLSNSQDHRAESYQLLVNLIVLWNLKSLLVYMESTEMLQIAATTVDDNVLPFLKTLLELDPSLDVPLQQYGELLLAQLPFCMELPNLPEEEECFLDGDGDLEQGAED
ncbi:heterokaryon incompatibility protein-domain-containing protein [Boeremia exigua]|uniref:heterokaryon incompatibility protein-domain-containing protein n=1 Tax=Boeremia exigua TaxID=749465 RepID=UPI001E8D1347|nr:heterokaryon incompatibility protein-domain-containing protein [Boeremia exigua]KAH6644167.1 heterokaryon incompatibility protein-domain-containing protein [Boeremia exigua]